MSEATNQQPNPSHIMQIGMGFWASKTLLAAVKLNLFTLLSGTKLNGNAIKQQLALGTTDRHVYDWLDALVSLGFLVREGVMENSIYSNSMDTEIFLDRKNPSYIGGILEMGNNRLYRFWGDLEEGLLTGRPQNESKDESRGNMDFFMQLYKDPVKLEEFMDAMSGIQLGNFMLLARKFDFSKFKTLLDVGGADGSLSIHICRNYPSIRCTTFDLPTVAPLANKKIAEANLSVRISFIGGDFATDPILSAEIITMGNILHGLDEATKQILVNKVYAALPANGVFITIENIIDDDRRENTFGMLMSLNMLIENGEAFDYTPADFGRWTTKAGFQKTEILPLAGPSSAAIAYK